MKRISQFVLLLLLLGTVKAELTHEIQEDDLKLKKRLTARENAIFTKDASKQSTLRAKKVKASPSLNQKRGNEHDSMSINVKSAAERELQNVPRFIAFLLVLFGLSLGQNFFDLLNTNEPSAQPSSKPSASPEKEPPKPPSSAPSKMPSAPTSQPSAMPSMAPSDTRSSLFFFLQWVKNVLDLIDAFLPGGELEP